jgi:hypothetical protein
MKTIDMILSRRASLDNTAYVASALADRDLARRAAEHKTMSFRERDGQGDVIDYNPAVLGALQLAPDGQAEELLAADYAGMVNDGLLFEKPLGLRSAGRTMSSHSRSGEQRRPHRERVRLTRAIAISPEKQDIQEDRGFARDARPDVDRKFNISQ